MPEPKVTAPTPTVYKYLLEGGAATVGMPQGAIVRHVHEQDSHPCLWVEVNTSAPIVERHFLVLATGQAIPPSRGAKYLGTVHIEWTVWHVYEVARG